MKEDYFADGVMDMPTPCQHCGGIFDLNDGSRSDKWYPNTVICEDCGRLEEKEIEQDEEMQELVDILGDAYYTVKETLLQLVEKGFLTDPTDPDRLRKIAEWKSYQDAIAKLWL